MKKLSKIFESIWSDMQDRGAGDMIKREDDINLLDGEGFAEYLKKLYKNVDTPFKIFIDVENVITVPILKSTKGQLICVHYDCTNNIVYGRYDFLYYQDPDLFEKLRKDYKTFMLKKSFATYVRFEPRVGEFSNEFFIEIIDFYLENCDVDLKKILVKNVNESIWSDMQDRGTGDKIKEEDSIDRFEKNQLMDYLRDTYEPLGGTFISGVSKSIYIPFDKPLKKTWAEQCVCIVFDDSKKDITKLKLFGIDSNKLADIKNILNDFYIEYARSGGVVTLTPKTGKLTNSICVDVLDKMLEIAQKPYYRKQ